MDSMRIIERFPHCKKNGLCRFNAHCKKNKSSRLSRLNLYCSYKVEALNGLPAGLNHPTKLVAILEAKTDICTRHLSWVDQQ